MFKKLTLSALTALAIGTTGAMAAGTGGHIENIDFSFDGAFGAYDQAQLQRGLQVYTEVCASCHGLQYVPLRTLGDAGGPQFSEAEVRAYAEQNFEIFDEALDDFRPAIPADNFPANTSAGAPDLTLMAKARAGFHGPYGLGINQFFKGIGGPEYIVALLNGYADAPDCTPDDMEGAYNTVFASGGYPESCKDEAGHHLYPGSWIAMGQPLYGEDVEYADGHPTTLHHEAEDVAAFLMWAAEPKMMARKQAGFTAVLFLTVLSVLLYLTNKRIWKPVKYGRKDS
ncbi:cytochrome c1 [Pelagimonas varians]|uniref:Cytochrome c1 n=1 Tax=Pelagimonas varians TaxID=696760 RepID=A0A238KRD3_9RHOB|nr:cytochrome c1 [Pelagimonas varians]PYG28572.1 ubiquinol-cytochrome c reductase cytochrome c1 subunit [Pelagimonas varians]SMX45237.1 Cytochrome c1 precursor [Pelagimonas varians]